MQQFYSHFFLQCALTVINRGEYYAWCMHKQVKELLLIANMKSLKQLYTKGFSRYINILYDDIFLLSALHLSIKSIIICCKIQVTFDKNILKNNLI